MKGFNNVVLMGNITRDPELRTTPNGQSVCSISLAVNSKRGETERVDYFDCTAWAKSGEIIAKYMQKGGAILVEGRLVQRSWEQDGKKRSKVEVVIDNFNFVGGGDAPKAESKPPVASDPIDEPIKLEDIPF